MQQCVNGWQWFAHLSLEVADMLQHGSNKLLYEHHEVCQATQLTKA